jgi:signal recognition particle receptor subunit alpha
MIGINGVGKSTSLAKIAYYLQINQCNPLLAACDTFRSGAVEQLSVHASCLSLPLYHQGYAKDPSAVAKAAINKATEDGNDVVLVDTAGRMQNNVPLMKALAKLVTETSPDLVLFVCEALVGNDGMDQLTMFQKALTMGGHSRPIDGIVLTKFDTVSDKVGAALTLTHLTGVPIAFCGTGQKYNHLKPLSVPFVIQSLFS